MSQSGQANFFTPKHTNVCHKIFTTIQQYKFFSHIQVYTRNNNHKRGRQIYLHISDQIHRLFRKADLLGTGNVLLEETIDGIQAYTHISSILGKFENVFRLHTSVVDPNSLYLDPDSDFCPDLDPDPNSFTQLHYGMNFEKILGRYFVSQIVSFQFLTVWIWIQIRNTDPQSCSMRIQFGSGSTTLLPVHPVSYYQFSAPLYENQTQTIPPS